MRDEDVQDLLRAAESNLDKPPLDTAQFARKVRRPPSSRQTPTAYGGGACAVGVAGGGVGPASRHS